MTLHEIMKEYHIILRQYDREFANQRLSDRLADEMGEKPLFTAIQESFNDDGTLVKTA